MRRARAASERPRGAHGAAWCAAGKIDRQREEEGPEKCAEQRMSGCAAHRLAEGAVGLAVLLLLALLVVLWTGSRSAGPVQQQQQQQVAGGGGNRTGATVFGRDLLRMHERGESLIFGIFPRYVLCD